MSVCDRKIMMIKNSGMVRFEQQVFRVTEVVKLTGELKLSIIVPGAVFRTPRPKNVMLSLLSIVFGIN